MSTSATDRGPAQPDDDREQLLRAVLAATHEGVWLLDPEGTTRFANARLAELLGRPLEDLQDRPIEDVVAHPGAARIRDRLDRGRWGLAETFEVNVPAPDGSWRSLGVSTAPLPHGIGTLAPRGGTLAFVTDAAGQAASEEALRRQACCDPTTGLPDRTLLEQRRRQLSELHARTGAPYGFLLCDIDGLKLVNDALGSAEGDQLIREVAQRLRQAARSGDYVTRSTAGQFVVLCPGVETFQARRIAQDLVAGVDGVLTLSGSTVWPSISVGVASTSEVAPADLAAAADAALSRAKRHGRGSVATFDAAAPKDHRSQLQMLADLRGSLNGEALQLHYQPIVHLPSSEVIGVEALMRWNRPGHGPVPPSVFIPLAEDAGLVAQLGAWSLTRACRDAAGWPARLSVAVNLSARQLADDSIVRTVASALDGSGLDPGRLWVEVTETAVFADVPTAVEHLHAIARLGVKVSLDDFGTGYSSLAYLRDFPVHAFKIDRSFVAGVGENPDDTAIVATLVSLARSLNLRLVAEGVETRPQRAELQRLGCDYGQGYLWRGAVPNRELLDVVSAIERTTLPGATGRATSIAAAVDPDLTARILAMHRQGASPATIAAALNGDAVPTPAGKRWHRNTVAHVIAAAVAG